MKVLTRRGIAAFVAFALTFAPALTLSTSVALAGGNSSQPVEQVGTGQPVPVISITQPASQTNVTSPASPSSPSDPATSVLQPVQQPTTIQEKSLTVTCGFMGPVGPLVTCQYGSNVILQRNGPGQGVLTDLAELMKLLKIWAGGKLQEDAAKIQLLDAKNTCKDSRRGLICPHHLWRFEAVLGIGTPKITLPERDGAYAKKISTPPWTNGVVTTTIDYLYNADGKLTQRIYRDQSAAGIHETRMVLDWKKGVAALFDGNGKFIGGVVYKNLTTTYVDGYTSVIPYPDPVTGQTVQVYGEFVFWLPDPQMQSAPPNLIQMERNGLLERVEKLIADTKTQIEDLQKKVELEKKKLEPFRTEFSAKVDTQRTALQDLLKELSNPVGDAGLTQKVNDFTRRVQTYLDDTTAYSGNEPHLKKAIELYLQFVEGPSPYKTDSENLRTLQGYLDNQVLPFREKILKAKTREELVPLRQLPPVPPMIGRGYDPAPLPFVDPLTQLRAWIEEGGVLAIQEKTQREIENARNVILAQMNPQIQEKTSQVKNLEAQLAQATRASKESKKAFRKSAEELRDTLTKSRADLEALFAKIPLKDRGQSLGLETQRMIAQTRMSLRGLHAQVHNYLESFDERPDFLRAQIAVEKENLSRLKAHRVKIERARSLQTLAGLRVLPVSLPPPPPPVSAAPANPLLPLGDLISQIERLRSLLLAATGKR